MPKSSTPSRQPRAGPSSTSSRKLPGCGSAWSSPVRAGLVEEEARQQLARAVAHLRGALRDHLRQRHAVHPLRDQHLVRAVHHVGHHHVRVVGELDRVRVLGLRLQLVVQLLRDPVAQLGDQRLDVHAGNERPEQPGHPAELVEVRQQGVPGAGVLDLHRDLAAVVPHGPVHLPDRGGRRRAVVELGEELAPVLAEALGQYGVHGAGGHRRRRVLKLGEGGTVGARDLLGQGGLEDRQGLPELHGAALQLAEDLEELFGRPLLQLGGDLFRGAPAEPLAQSQRRPPGESQWERRQLGGTGHRFARKIRHAPPLSDRSRRHCPPPLPDHGTGGVTNLMRRRSPRHPRCARRTRTCGPPAPAVPPSSAGRDPSRRVRRSSAAARRRRRPARSAAASPATVVARAMSQAGTPPRPDRNCASTLGQAASASAIRSPRHPAHPVLPGTTRGPTTPRPSSTPV